MPKTDPKALAQAMTPHERESLLYGIGLPLGDNHDWSETEILETCERLLAQPRFERLLANDEIVANAKRRMIKIVEPPMSKKKSGGVDRVAYSIDEFCHAYGISKSFYFKMKDRGETPREMRVGHRVLISFEASAEWRKAREAESPT